LDRDIKIGKIYIDVVDAFLGVSPCSSTSLLQWPLIRYLRYLKKGRRVKLRDDFFRFEGLFQSLPLASSLD
jgi:hypothetical protein